MSRLHPYQNSPSPAICRWNWRGGDGTLTWYDKEADNGKGGKGLNIIETLPFTVIYLDETACVTGYDEEKESFLFSNEIKDTLTQPFTVKWQKKGLGKVASGLWRAIKPTIKGCGGNYSCRVYVGFKDEDVLKIGVMTMGGCARSAWIDFKNANRDAITKQAIVIKAGEVEHNPRNKKIEYTPPAFSLVNIKPETDKAAMELCKEVEAYLASYFKRPSEALAAAQPESDVSESPQPNAPADDGGEYGPVEAEDIPF